MAAIFQLRRGTGNIDIVDGELYLHKGTGSVQFGSGSTPYTLLHLNAPAYGDVNLIGNISASGDVRLGGNIYLGDGTGVDNISALGVFNTNLVPSGQRDVGTTIAPWNNVYATSISASVVSGSFSGNVNGIDLTALSASIDSQFDGISIISSSLIASASSFQTRFSTLGTYTASVETRLSTISTQTASFETRFGTLSTYTASVNTRLTEIGVVSGSLISSASANRVSITNINSLTSSVLTQLTTLGSVTASLETRAASLATITGSLINSASADRVSITELNAYTSSLKTAITASGANVTINGNLTVKGTTTQIDSTTLNIGDNIIELNYGGSQTLAGIYTKDATGTSLVSGSILWDSANGLDYWKAGKSGSESKILLAGGDNIISSSMQLTELNNATASFEARAISLATITGSLIGSASSFETRFGTLSTYSSSVETRFGAIATETASLEARATSLATISGSLISSASSFETRFGTLSTYSSSVETRFGAIATETASLETRATSLATITGSLISSASSFETRFGTLSTYSSSVETRFGAIATETASLETRATTLAQVTSSIHAFTASTSQSLWQLYSASNDHEGRIDYIELQAGISVTYNFTEQFAALAQVTSSLISATSSYETKGRGIVSSSAQLVSAFEEKASSTHTLLSGSSQVLGGSGVWSGSAQLPNGVVSGSSQVIGILSSLNSFTSSLDATYATEAEVAAGYEAKGRGIWSGSAQLPAGVVSGSSQVTAGSTANFATDVKTQLNSNTVLSGSSQVDLTSTTNYVSGIKTRLNAEGVISGSSQIITANSITLGTHTTGAYIQTITGTANQVIVAGSGLESADVTLSLPQSIATTSDVTFNNITASAGIRAVGDIIAYYSSDERLKENITPIENALSKVELISGNTYNWKEGYENIHPHKGNDVGVIAQEVEKVLPQVVINRENGFKAVDYEKIVPLLIEAIKELSAKVDRLENK